MKDKLNKIILIGIFVIIFVIILLTIVSPEINSKIEQKKYQIYMDNNPHYKIILNGSNYDYDYSFQNRRNENVSNASGLNIIEFDSSSSFYDEITVNSPENIKIQIFRNNVLVKDEITTRYSTKLN